MNKVKLNNKGFGVVEGLLVLVIIGIVGGTGYYVFNANKKADSGSNGSKIVSDKRKVFPNQIITENNTNYLLIKEWGVKFPVSEKMQDIYYYYKKYNGGEAVYFSNKALATKFPECAADQTSRIALGRYVKGDTLKDEPVERISDAVMVEGHYYVHEGPDSSCYNEGTEGSPKKDKTDNVKKEDYIKAFSMLEVE